MNPHLKPSLMKSERLIQDLKAVQETIKDLTSEIVQNSEKWTRSEVDRKTRSLRDLKARFLDLVSEAADRSLITVETTGKYQKILFRL
jgi:hypothetical protein